MSAPEAIDIDRYATVSPHRAQETLSRYGVSPESHAALDAYWKARLSADPVLKMAFAQKYAAFVAWLKQSPSGAAPGRRAR